MHFLSSTKTYFACALVFVLAFFNYGIEVKKWQLLLNFRTYNYNHHLKAFLSGAAISLFMPFRTGEYIGRIVYFKKREWSRVIISSIRAGLLQLLVTFFFGVICSLLILPKIQAIISISVSAWIILFLLGVVLVAWIIRVIPRVIEKLAKKFKLAIYPTPNKELTVPALLSFARYSVFIFQYFVLFYFLDIGELTSVLILIPVFLFIQTVVPTFFLSEIGLRITLASYLFESNLVLLPIFIIYLINILLPALIGVFYLKKWKS